MLAERAVGWTTALLSLLIAGPALAQNPDDFYRNRQIEFIVATETGTTYDQWARLLSRFMPRKIPGEPTLIVKNMPGAGQIRAASYLYSVAQKDGSSFGTFSRNIATAFLTKNEAIKFDLSRFQWIGSTDISNRICVVNAGSNVDKAADLFTREATFGGAGAGSGISAAPMLVAALLDMKMKLVEGYKGGPEVMLAMERGEVEGTCNTLDGVESSRPGWIAQGKLRVLFNMEKAPVARLRAPTIYDFVKTEEQRKILAFFGANVELGRLFAAPPEAPPDRVALLRRAFEAALHDHDLIAEAERLHLEMSPYTGEELKARIDEFLTTPATIVEATAKLTGGGG